MIRAVVLLALTLWPVIALSQEDAAPAAVLVADDVFIAADRELVARGNVEVFQDGVRLEAEEIRYDRVSGALVIQGPIRMQDGDSITVLASAAELEPDLRSGILTGARVVMNQQLQLSAAQMQRVNDRYSQLSRTAVTSCEVCDDGKPPLWQIRARRVIHDREERQLYFDQAQFRIRNVPVFYLPRLRLPDPTVERATGFLFPTYESTSDLGFGIKIPYFITLGDDRDLTVTPYLSSRTRTVELRYRQAFTNGDIIFNGAVSRDDLMEGKTRGYVFGQGNFALRNDFRLVFDVELTSDDDYLQDYGYSGKDRLDSQVAISRYRRDELIFGSLVNFNSLRDGEGGSTSPSIVGDLYYERRFFPAAIGGELRFSSNAHNHIRYSERDIDGRDVSRFNTQAEWLRGWTIPGGARAETTIGLAGDIFNITQDSTTNQNQTQFTPYTTVALRYPMTRVDSTGATQFLEPIAQLAWTGSSQLDIPNEESTLVDFDEGNLLALSRFPAPDRRERGTVGAYGVNWARFAPTGWQGNLTLGQVVRNQSDDSFTEASGLSGLSSDYLVAGQLKTENGWALTARTLFDDSFDFTKAEVRGSYDHRRGRVSGSYLWLVEDPSEDRLLDTSEVYLNGLFNVDKNWAANADWRYDLIENRASTASLGMTYFNECVEIGFSVQRRYTSSSSLEPTTRFGLSIGLRGFSALSGSNTYSRTCG
ncbi:LPS-assembly protein LptD [Roseobacter weihaiensis]|uniref:LPS-assembly protein LptD n=1 Tax=Roseobacter weihaiensis TaxID=2763262 RepID=UPI001D0B2D43|nr:LPS assembly protein LptD [Roseobacter sp. H9]